MPRAASDSFSERYIVRTRRTIRITRDHAHIPPASPHCSKWTRRRTRSSSRSSRWPWHRSRLQQPMRSPLSPRKALGRLSEPSTASPADLERAWLVPTACCPPTSALAAASSPMQRRRRGAPYSFTGICRLLTCSSTATRAPASSSGPRRAEECAIRPRNLGALARRGCLVRHGFDPSAPDGEFDVDPDSDFRQSRSWAAAGGLPSATRSGPEFFTLSSLEASGVRVRQRVTLHRFPCRAVVGAARRTENRTVVGTGSWR